MPKRNSFDAPDLNHREDAMQFIYIFIGKDAIQFITNSNQIN